MSATGTAIATTYDAAQVGKPAPDFEIPSTKNIEKLNEPVKLSDYRGKWVVLLHSPEDQDLSARRWKKRWLGVWCG